MGLGRRRCRFWAAGIAAIGLAAVVRAEAPAVWAIQGARIVPVSGPVLERGTLVLRDGLIRAVGPEVTVPGDARVIDGKGLAVYPGLIDAGSEIGLPEAPQQAPGAAPAAPTQAEEGGNLRSFFRAADAITDGGARAGEARLAGITSALATPNRGIIAGQSAVINLNGDRATSVVRPSVAMHVRLSGGGFREYPGSLMGMLAYLKQQVMDARRYREAWSIYEQNDQSLARPETHRGLEALGPAADGRQPLVIPAATAAEIQRALQLQSDLKLRVWVSGGLESARAAEHLRASETPVLLSLRFPAPPASEEATESLRALRLRVEAPAAGHALARAGVPFAFTSSGLTGAEFLAAARRVARTDLGPDQTLRALTLGAAELLGVGRRLGSLEPGKIANVLVVDGDLFDDRTRVRHVFVDGRYFEGAARR